MLSIAGAAMHNEWPLPLIIRIILGSEGNTVAAAAHGSSDGEWEGPLTRCP